MTRVVVWMCGLAVVAGVTPGALADTQTFQVQGTLNSYQDPSCTDTNGCPSGTLTGTLAIDTAQGSITGSNLLLTNGGDTYRFANGTSFQGTDPNASCDHVNGGCIYTSYDAIFSDGSDTLSLYFATPTLVGYGGNELCTENDWCGNDEVLLMSNFDQYTAFVADDATVTLVTTPEPSSLMLLGTGVAGAAGVLRRRFRRG